jgi:hypothetical protein
MLDWIADVVKSVVVVVFVLRDVGEESVVAKSGINMVGSNLIEFKFSYYTAHYIRILLTCMRMKIYLFLLL